MKLYRAAEPTAAGSLCEDYAAHKEESDGRATQQDYRDACYEHCVQTDGYRCGSLDPDRVAQAKAEGRARRRAAQIRACEGRPEPHDDGTGATSGEDDVDHGVGPCFSILAEIRGYQGESPAEAADCGLLKATLDRRCTANNLASCLALGELYATGASCVARDELKSVELLERTCAGHAQYACNLLARDGVGNRLARALEACEAGATGWCHQACMSGDHSDARVAAACTHESEYWANEELDRRYAGRIQRMNEEDAAAAADPAPSEPASPSSDSPSLSMTDAMRNARQDAAAVNAPLDRARRQMASIPPQERHRSVAQQQGEEQQQPRQRAEQRDLAAARQQLESCLASSPAGVNVVFPSSVLDQDAGAAQHLAALLDRERRRGTKYAHALGAVDSGDWRHRAERDWDHWFRDRYLSRSYKIAQACGSLPASMSSAIPATNCDVADYDMCINEWRQDARIFALGYEMEACMLRAELNQARADHEAECHRAHDAAVPAGN